MYSNLLLRQRVFHRASYATLQQIGFRKSLPAPGIWNYLLAISLCIHIPISIVVLYVVLYRILNLNYPGDRANDYYRKTLFLFIAGISLYFLLIVFSMFDSAIVNR